MAFINLTQESYIISEKIKTIISNKISLGEYSGKEDPFFYLLIQCVPIFYDLIDYSCDLPLPNLLRSFSQRNPLFRNELELVNILDWMLIAKFYNFNIASECFFPLMDSIKDYLIQEQDVSIQILFEFFFIASILYPDLNAERNFRSLA